MGAVFLNGRDVSGEIRTRGLRPLDLLQMHLSGRRNEKDAAKFVAKFDLVTEGRDQGTVVFHAD